MTEQYNRMEKHTPKHFLNHWYDLQTNINDLDGVQLAKARHLFKALKQLTSEEKELLSLKYLKPLSEKNGIRFKRTDQNIADELGITKNKYASQRRAIEYKLIPIFIEQDEQYKKELRGGLRTKEFRKSKERSQRASQRY